MPSFIRTKTIAHLLLPPIITRWLARTKPYLPADTPEVTKPRPYLEYAPDGWKTQQQSIDIKGWDVNSVVDTEKDKWQNFCDNCQGAGPLGFSHEYPDLAVVRDVSFHNVHITYAYVLALAAHFKTVLSILDWGGALGHYYQIAQAVLPDVSVEFHCKEVPSMAEVGRLLNPEVHWYVDESCLERSYDLIMVNGSLQYFEDWKETLQRLAPAVKEYFFLTRLPVVQHVPSFVAVQREYDTEMLHQQLNQGEVLGVVEAAGLRLVREFVVGPGPNIHGAPEPCEMRGWLFKRDNR